MDIVPKHKSTLVPWKSGYLVTCKPYIHLGFLNDYNYAYAVIVVETIIEDLMEDAQ